MTGPLTPPQHLFISPHLDDAVLSCGGIIHQLVEHGEPVTVLTIMAGDPPDPMLDTPIIRDLHQRWRLRYNPVKQRRQEDRLALSYLGAAHQHLVLQDCVYRFQWRDEQREAFYPTEAALWDEIHPDDPTLSFLFTVPIEESVQLYFPLGVGRHVDHRIVRDWGRSLMGNDKLALNWYAEYPYRQNEGSVEAALADFAPQVLAAELRLLAEADVQAKIGAINRYQSQITTFWDSTLAMEADVRDSLLRIGGDVPAEQLWRVVG